MKRIINFFAIIAVLAGVFSCETYKVDEPDMTAISKVDGKYMAFAYKDGSSEPTTVFAIVITNTTEDAADAGWITITDMDYTGLHWQHLFAVRFRLDVDAKAQTFKASNTETIEPRTAWNPYIEGAYGSYGAFTTASYQWGNMGTTTASIDGKVVTDGVTTGSGSKADSIEFTYTLNYKDGTSEKYTVKGMKKTGWAEDAKEYEDWISEQGWRP